MSQNESTSKLSQNRVGKITASLAGAFLNQSPFMTRSKALREMVKAARGEDTFQGNRATDYGNENEPIARELYFQETFTFVEDTSEFFVYQDGGDWLGATPDGVMDDKVLEIKCPFKRELFRIEEKPHYYTQVQIQMLCTGKQLCHFVVFNGEEITIEEVEFDQDYIDQILPVLKEAHNEFLAMLETSDDFELEAIGQEYADIDEQIKALQQQQKALKETLIERAEGHDLSLSRVTVSRQVRSGSYDYAKFIKDQQIELTDEYKKPDSESWTIRIVRAS
jgi:putative phage-type endonuclease